MHLCLSVMSIYIYIRKKNIFFTGPSHTMPSVIVAKIMEKLREHERENLSIILPHHVSDQNTSTDKKNKFSRIARNVLTKIRLLQIIYNKINVLQMLFCYKIKFMCAFVHVCVLLASLLFLSST